MSIHDAMEAACAAVGIKPPRRTVPGKWVQTPVEGKAATNGSGRVLVFDCCGWERPARSGIVAVDGTLREFSAAAYQARDGLRAEVLGSPKAVWLAALAYCMERRPHDEDKARRWAAGIWYGIYPGAKLGFGWYQAAPTALVDQAAYALVHREVQRFRKKGRAA